MVLLFGALSVYFFVVSGTAALSLVDFASPFLLQYRIPVVRTLHALAIAVVLIVFWGIRSPRRRSTDQP